MNDKRAILAALAIVVGLVVTPGVVVAQASVGDVAVMPLAEVAAGMRGYGLTVMQGWEPQRFDVEVLGILPDVFPKQPLIIARLTGLGLERAGVIAGMSGSPVYVQERLIGAVAYRLTSFGHEAIAGIVPIESMLAMPEAPPSAAGAAVAGTTTALLRAVAAAVTGEQVEPIESFGAVVGAGIEPVGTPLAMTGFDPRVVRAVTPLFRDHGWLIGSGGGTAEVRPYLQPGGAVAVQLVRGDVAVTAAGTVTYRDDHTLLAFGHPFIQAGEVDFPMVGAEVLTVLRASQSSSKLTVSGQEILGAIRQDRLPAVLGVVGEAPRLLPVSTKVRAPGVDDNLRFEVVVDPMLTPLYVFLGLVNGVQSVDDIGAGGSLQLDATLQLASGVQIRFQDLYSTATQAIVGAAADLAGVFAGLYDNRVEAADVGSVEIDLWLRADRKSASIARAWHDGASVRPGDEVQVSIALVPYRQPEEVIRVPLRVPADVRPGTLRILVGDAAAATGSFEQARGGVAEPRSLTDLAELFNRRRRRDRVYVQLLQPLAGARVGDAAMPALPSSRLRLLAGAADVVALREVLLADEAVPVDAVVAGSQTITVTVRDR